MSFERRGSQASVIGPEPDRDMLITREHAIAAATSVGRRLGYAIGVHGSRIRDLDLVAVPWTEEAETPLQLVKSIAFALPGVVVGGVTKKPHGRLAWLIYPRYRWGIDAWYIDISVMPRRRKRATA